MARPRSIQPDIRYRGELQFWADSVAAINDGTPPPVIECLNRNQAITARHKLNMARAFIRDETHPIEKDKYVGYHPWNSYTVKMEGLNIFIAEKQLFPWEQVKTADGTPYNPMPEVDTKTPLSDSELAILRQVQKLEAKVVTPPLNPPESTIPKPKMPPPPETHDHTKPLDLDIADE